MKLSQGPYVVRARCLLNAAPSDAIYVVLQAVSIFIDLDEFGGRAKEWIKR